MTQENILENDNPLAVYKKMNGVDMFMGITFNNIRVSFYAFMAGLLLSVGTILLLLYNGIMLGTFHHLFYSKGLLLKSLSIVWIHGTLEISSIIIAGQRALILVIQHFISKNILKKTILFNFSKRRCKNNCGLGSIIFLLQVFLNHLSQDLHKCQSL